jgi:glycosidase
MAAPDWLADAVFYQIFPERFGNGDASLNPPGTVAWDSAPTPTNFLGGDLAGIEAHLDHIASIGANTLYLTPIFEAKTNHRYDTVDYFRIDPALGTLDDFRRLVDAVHARGMRIVLDGVFNHCGDQHAYFRDVVENEADSEYVNWFSVEGFPVVTEPTANYRTFMGCVNLPKWNCYNPAVREHHYRVARYWLDQGIDGWRLDVPFLINLPFWRGFRRVVKEVSAEKCLIAEEWREPDQWLAGDTMDGTMGYVLRNLILGFIADRTLDAREFAAGMNRLYDRIPAGFHHGMMNLLGSHDTERVLTHCHGAVESVKDCFTLLFAAAGAPMVYYGDEVGMSGGNDPGCRAGMVWDAEQWDVSTLAHIRALTRARAEHPALRRGAQRVTAVDPETVCVTRSLTGGESVDVVVTRGFGAPVASVLR